MDDESSEVDEYFEQPELCPVASNIIDIDHVYTKEFQDRFREFEEEWDYLEAAAEELISWFSCRWVNAGGKNFTLKATIAPHDDIREFNLVSSKWEDRW